MSCLPTMGRCVRLLLLAVGLAPPVARADTLTRDRVADLARDRAPLVLDADARRLEARGRLTGARILTDNPTLDLVTGGDADEARRTEIELTAPIGLGLARARRIGVARAELRREESLVADARRLAVGAALNAYYRVLHATRRLEVERERLALTDRLRAAVGERLHSGDVARLDLAVAELEASRARSALLVEQQGLIDARAELGQLLGLATMAGVEVLGDLSDRAPFDSLVVDVDADAGDRPDVRAAARQREAAEAARALAATAALPGFALRLNYSHQGEITEWMPGVAFSLPVFDRGQGMRAETRARADGARLAYERLSAAARAQAEAARLAYADAVAAVGELEQQALPRAVEVEGMAERSYLSGKSNLGSMLALRRETLDTRKEHVDRLLEAARRGIDVALTLGPWPSERNER